MAERDQIFIASDLHLGVPDAKSSRQREQYFVSWLNKIRPRCKELILLGDIFDFWFEYKHVVPKGFVRLQGALASMADEGVKIRYFIGNHDLWQKQYFEDEIGLELHTKPWQTEWFGKKYFLAHGDGLGPGDHGYKFLRKLFHSPLLQWMYARLHPNMGVGMANYFSRLSRRKTGHKDAVDYGENEYLLIFAKEMAQKQPEIQYFIFGHRHFPKQLEFAPQKYYVNTGDWISNFTFFRITPEDISLMQYLPAVDDFRTFAAGPEN